MDSQPKAEVVAAAAKSEAALPDMPGYMIACINKAHLAPAGKKGADGKAKAATANDKVAALHKTAEDRQKCGQSAVSWYRTLQATRAGKKAEAPAAKKPAG